MADHAVPVRSFGRSFALWFGLLAPVVTWGLRLVVSYGIEEIVCSSGSSSFDVLGLPVRATILAECAVLFTVSVVAGVIAWVTLRRARADGSSERVRWMAWSGIFSSALFSLLIFVESVPVAILPLCEATL